MRNWLTTTWKKDPLVFCAWAIAFALLIGFGMSLWLLGHAKLFGGMSVSSAEVLRDIALTVAALLGFPLLLQRTRAATRQVDIDSQRLLADRYARSAELFANAELSARLAGLYALWDLAKEEVKIYHVRIMEILCAFVRNPPELKGWKSGDDQFPAQRLDVNAVLKLIRKRSEGQHQQEDTAGYWLSFEGADLRGANFDGAYLRRAIFNRANLQGAFFDNTDLQSAYFWNVRLQHTLFLNADLRKSSFHFSEPGAIKGQTLINRALALLDNAAVNGAGFSRETYLMGFSLRSAVVLTDDEGKDLPPGPPSLPPQFDAIDLPRMTLQEWEKKRGKKAMP